MMNKNDLQTFVNLYNGKMNVYYTIYDYEAFTEKLKIDSSVILDRAFLDFDAHNTTTIEEAYGDFKIVVVDLLKKDIKFDMFFSGKGFHVIVYGKKANEIREIQAWFRDLKNTGLPTLDDSGIQINRLRRVPNTVNLSSEDEDGEPYFCIPILKEDLHSIRGLDYILELAKEPRMVLSRYGNKLVEWPTVKPMDEVSETEVDIVRPVKSLPILPCLYNAIMVQNPGHYARVYLVQWYRDILSFGEREISLDNQKEITDTIMSELMEIASKPDVWLDWDYHKTHKYVWGIVSKGYNAPSCYKILIPQGYCIGKCRRYHDVSN